jgi:hypothetical protein
LEWRNTVDGKKAILAAKDRCAKLDSQSTDIFMSQDVAACKGKWPVVEPDAESKK